jgi:apolipoprotein N-acyltransferase
VGLGANLIVNLTNDDWYGPTSMPAQHLAFSVLRSVENGVPVARAANSGISALVDPRKGVTARLDLGVRDVLSGTLAPGKPAGTFYTRHGDVFAVCCVGIGILLLLLGRASGRPEPKPA